MASIIKTFGISKKNSERTRLLMESAEQKNYLDSIHLLCYDEVTDEDISLAIEYMINTFHCQDFEPLCGTHIGCSECLYNHFRETVLVAFKKVKLLQKENEELRNILSSNNS